MHAIPSCVAVLQTRMTAGLSVSPLCHEVQAFA